MNHGRPAMGFLLLLLCTSLGCGPHWSCPPGYTPVCQSGERYGTRCVCEPPLRYGESRGNPGKPFNASSP